ncbi:hypothetical protein GAP32_430 [Cronobacter phage vB_CsaM_GAP32]|uniref:SprT-like domain-containing protein n=1 Tax=Cronobacter phage vB_CsaM_GAP32 TaxID=1141136 RepID=K4F770_9CAUD|nr:hypothetical protein GAP32_430 [Cronobacter phage vB_CsaM_GAP32]AFC21883.1 hypothetical protein GAP32_430 [Cronobacter phage vB_CsaM_GAP32]
MNKRFQILIKRLVMNIYKIAKELMNKHNLQDWSFEIYESSNKRVPGTTNTIGMCIYHEKVIAILEAVAYSRSEEYVRSLILHEIAHALAGHENGHNEVWQKIAIEIGSKHITSCANMIEFLNHKNTIRNCTHPYVWKFMKYFSNTDELVFNLNRIHGKSTQYWYNEYLRILKFQERLKKRKKIETNQKFVV